MPEGIRYGGRRPFFCVGHQRGAGVDADEILRRQPWLPEDYEKAPERIRDNEQAIDFLRSDMDSVKSWLKAGVTGIWLLVVQVLAEWIAGGGLF